MKLKDKVALYEHALHIIACWNDGDVWSRLDEPGSAGTAREALQDSGAVPMPAPRKKRVP